MVDSLSKELVNSGTLSDAIEATIDGNMNVYLNTSYAYYNDNYQGKWMDQFSEADRQRILDAYRPADSQAATTWQFGFISDNAIKRVDLNSVTYILYVDQYSCNDLTLNEVGLFMKNPQGLGINRSTLVAYRPFTDITKTDDFSLVFKWTLNF